jgi:hypothetical protein
VKDRRSFTRPEILELLAKKGPDGSFIGYSGDDLEAQAKENEAEGTASRWIKDLRNHIQSSLRDQANIDSGVKDVILSGGPGYRFAECVSVQFGNPPPIADITDVEGSSDVREVRDDESEKRRSWILQQLAAAVRLKAPHVADRFNRSKKTAQRDLDTLRVTRARSSSLATLRLVLQALRRQEPDDDHAESNEVQTELTKSI